MSHARVGLRFTALTFALTSVAACNAVFGVRGGHTASGASTGSGGTATTSSSGTTTSGSAGAGGLPAPVCDGSRPGADGTTARWALAAGGIWDEHGAAVAFGQEQTLVVAGTYADDGTALGSGPLPYVETYPDGSKGESDIFVARFDLTGKNLWAQSFRGEGSQGLGSFLQMRSHALRLAVDPSDHILLAGNFRGAFRLGQIDLTNDTSLLPDAFDGFVARLDPSGAPLWAKRLGGPGNDLLLGLAADAHGDAFLAATTANGSSADLSVDFGCGAETVPVQPTAGGVQWIFVSKLGTDGACLWHQRFQVESGFSNLNNLGGGVALTLDPQGDVILALGAYTDGTFIGQGSLGAAQSHDVIVAKLGGADGSVIWRQAYGAPDPQTVWAVATNACGDVFVGGEFDRTAAFADLPALAAPPTAAPSSTSAFLLKLAADADPQKPPKPAWARAFADDGWQTITALAVDDAGKVTLVGNLVDGPASIGVDFGDGHRVPPLPDDAGAFAYHPSFFIAKLGADGAYAWAKRYATDQVNVAHGVAVDARGHTAVTGAATSPLDFGGASTALAPDHEDAFVVLLGP
jgi:hypothetical protein